MVQINQQVIFWDFDGVILDSMQVRDKGFEEVLSNFPESEVKDLLEFHRNNGGLSRYVKFRYFFESIRNQKITEEEIQDWAERFSVIMKRLLIDRSLLISDSMAYIQEHSNIQIMHIVSGSDQNELRYLCTELGISTHFKSIHGSPTPKKQLVKELLAKHNYPSSHCVLIGDSYNDFEAASDNGIQFYGYNNEYLKHVSNQYITAFT